MAAHGASSPLGEVTVPLDNASAYLDSLTEKQVRLGFVRKVYSILSAQLLLTVAIAIPFQLMTPAALVQYQWIFFIGVGVTLATTCALACCMARLRSYPQNYIFLFVLTAAMGILVGFSGAMYTWQSVVLSAGVTVAIFLAMTIYAWKTNNDFTGLGPYLFVALTVLCAFGVTLSLLSLLGVHIQWMIMIYDVVGVLLFTFYIVYDTQIIIGGSHRVKLSVDDYCFAALILYLDIINLFLHLLRLFGLRRS